MNKQVISLQPFVPRKASSRFRRNVTAVFPTSFLEFIYLPEHLNSRVYYFLINI